MLMPAIVDLEPIAHPPARPSRWQMKLSQRPSTWRSCQPRSAQFTHSAVRFHHTHEPRARCTPELTSSRRSRAEQVKSKKREDHPLGVDRKIQQALAPANGTTPPRPPPPCTLHAPRANHVLSTSRGRQISQRQLTSLFSTSWARQRKRMQTQLPQNAVAVT